MNELRDQALAWLNAGETWGLVTVIQARGSTPRAAGTRMLVAAERLAGTIGGGHLELQAIRLARQALTGPQFTAFEQRFALGPSLGQCCGGDVVLRIEPLTLDGITAWPAQDPRFHLLLYGAGHVGHALAQALSPICCVVDWIDSRDTAFEELAPGTLASLPPHIRAVVSDAPEQEATDAPPTAYHLVMTHNHDLDLRICRAVLSRNQFGFLGVIGSATKHARFVRRLRDVGLPADVIDRMISPIGVPGIVGKEPEVIALAVAAQLLMASSR